MYLPSRGTERDQKSKESRFWLMASEHSTSCLVDRDTSLSKIRSTNDDQSSNRRLKPSLMPTMDKGEQLVCRSIESQEIWPISQFNSEIN